MKWEVYLPDESATLQIAARLALSLPVHQPFVVHLHGDLGTGKTALTRGMLRAMGEQGPVRSPTYGLISEYLPAAGRVLHLDLYRLRSPDELESLGLADYLADSRLWLIEWPEQARGARLPAADSHVFLSVEGAGRRLRIESQSEAGGEWLRRLNSDGSS